ncbi:hypothetical protein ACT3UM_19490 [Halomonas sp. AOP13-D3-9]
MALEYRVVFSMADMPPFFCLGWTLLDLAQSCPLSQLAMIAPLA